MCGIAGIFNLTSPGGVDPDLLRAMTSTLVHRGPDSEGYHRDGRVGLGFRRLSIVDLATGDQPIFNEDRTVAVVCNGEIFNQLERRAQLEARGHVFRTKCDVEVLVHLFEEDPGGGFLADLNGQFACALYDVRAERLLLARDHFGIVPLFYTTAGDTFLFGSEIKAILEHPAVRREVDLTGLDQILTFPGLVSPRTMFRNIQSLEPGHLLEVQPGSVRKREYWDLDFPLEGSQEERLSHDEYRERLAEHLKASVRTRLQSDVPVGFYLSGGVDSSLIAALIHEASPGTVRDSFAIAFQNREIDERRYQRLVAGAVGSRHHEFDFDWPDIETRLQRVIRHNECPIKESYNTCSLALSGQVHAHGLKVVLTGEGSDELFAGYVGYRFDLERRKAAPAQYGLDELLERQAREDLWGDPDLFYERDYHAFREVKQALYAPDLAEHLERIDCTQSPVVATSRLAGRHPLHKRAYLDFKLRLADHLVGDHGDRVAYANSVEARFPFLDPQLFAFARTIPVDLLIRDGVEKRILREVAQPYLPAEIVARRKFGFVAPGSPYLLGRHIDWIDDLLSTETIKKQGYFNPVTVARLRTLYLDDQFTINQTFETDLLMLVLTFGIFLEAFSMPSL